MKKVIKTVAAVLGVTLVLWCGMFVTDYVRIGNLKEPVFAVRQDEADSYSGLGYTVTVKRTENENALEYTEMIMFGKVISAAVACY